MIKVKEVSKNFEDFVALDNITCNISDGCIYGMVGSNGAGKSTFLRVLAGIYKPEKGEAYIDDAPIYENPKIKENVVLVADELFFLPGTNMNKMAKLYASIYEIHWIWKYQRQKTLNTDFKRCGRILYTTSARYTG